MFNSKALYCPRADRLRAIALINLDRAQRTPQPSPKADHLFARYRRLTSLAINERIARYESVVGVS